MEKSQPPPYSPQAPALYPSLAPNAPPLQPPTHTVIVHTTVQRSVGPNSEHMECPSCHSQITTKVTNKATTKTHLWAVLMCVLGCWCCCCIPYCTNSCQTQNHNCPKCKAYLGSYNH